MLAKNPNPCPVKNNELMVTYSMMTGDGASQNNSAHSSLLKPDLGQELGVEEEEVIPDTRRFRLQPEQSQQCKSMCEAKLHNCFENNLNSIALFLELLFLFVTENLSKRNSSVYLE